jgi:hypothetical protein
MVHWTYFVDIFRDEAIAAYPTQYAELLAKMSFYLNSFEDAFVSGHWSLWNGNNWTHGDLPLFVSQHPLAINDWPSWNRNSWTHGDLPLFISQHPLVINDWPLWNRNNWTHGARFSTRNYTRGAPLSFTSLLRLKRWPCVWPMPFLSGGHFLTGSHCKSRPNTEGQSCQRG